LAGVKKTVDDNKMDWKTDSAHSHSDQPACNGSVFVLWLKCQSNIWGTAVAAPPPFRPGNPAVCGSRPLVTPYYCRLGDLLCFVFMSAYCMFDLSVYHLFLQYFDTIDWVFWPVKTVSHITSTVLVWTLNAAQSNPSK